jgi:anti-sigma factor RsiW
LNCKAVILEISNYIDRDIDAMLRQEFEAHLAECEECTLVVLQTRYTIEIFCNEEPSDLGADAHRRLFDALRSKLRQAGPGI